MAEESERGSALTADQVGLPGAQYIPRGRQRLWGGRRWHILPNLDGAATAWLPFAKERLQSQQQLGSLRPCLALCSNPWGRRRLQTRLCERVCCPGRQTVSYGFGGVEESTKMSSPEFPTRAAWLDNELHSFQRSPATVDGLFPQWLPIPAAQPSLEKLCQVWSARRRGCGSKLGVTSQTGSKSSHPCGSAHLGSLGCRLLQPPPLESTGELGWPRQGEPGLP